MEEFGRRVRAQRVRQKWSLERLAEEAGMHFTYVGSIERGRRNVSLNNIVRLAAALDLDAGRLVKGLRAPKRVITGTCGSAPRSRARRTFLVEFKRERWRCHAGEEGHADVESTD